MLRQGRHRGGSGNGVEGEGAEREPVGAVQEEVSLGIVGKRDEVKQRNLLFMLGSGIHDHGHLFKPDILCHVLHTFMRCISNTSVCQKKTDLWLAKMCGKFYLWGPRKLEFN